MNSDTQSIQRELNVSREKYSQSVDAAVKGSGQSHEFFLRVKAECLIRALKTEISDRSSLKVLDIGCGHGLYHSYLIDAFGPKLDLTGVDSSVEVIAEAKKSTLTVRYDSYNGTELPYDDSSFDAAYAICVMHHVPPKQWRIFLEETKRILKPGGIFAIGEHNPLNPATVRIVKKHPYDRDAVLIGNSYLRKLLAETGYNGIQVKHLLFTPFNNGFFRWFDKKMSWLPLGAQYFVFATK